MKDRRYSHCWMWYILTGRGPRMIDRTIQSASLPGRGHGRQQAPRRSRSTTGCSEHWGRVGSSSSGSSGGICCFNDKMELQRVGVLILADAVVFMARCTTVSLHRPLHILGISIGMERGHILLADAVVFASLASLGLSSVIPRPGPSPTCCAPASTLKNRW